MKFSSAPCQLHALENDQDFQITSRFIVQEFQLGRQFQKAKKNEKVTLGKSNRKWWHRQENPEAHHCSLGILGEHLCILGEHPCTAPAGQGRSPQFLCHKQLWNPKTVIIIKFLLLLRWLVHMEYKRQPLICQAENSRCADLCNKFKRIATVQMNINLVSHHFTFYCGLFTCILIGKSFKAA